MFLKLVSTKTEYLEKRLEVRRSSKLFSLITLWQNNWIVGDKI